MSDVAIATVGGMSLDLLLSWPKWQLVAFARKVKEQLPHEDIIVSGRKADIAYAVMIAIQNNPEEQGGKA